MTASASPVRVLLCDDHPVVRAGLRALLEGDDRIAVLREDSTPEQAIGYCATTPPSAPDGIDVVFMDLRFGEPASGAGAGAATASPARGVWATQQLRALPSPPQVLVVTNHDTDAEILGAVEAGAVGYLLKDATPEELINGALSAAAGESVLSPHVASRLMTRVRTSDRALTPRELQVLSLVAQGAGNREVARELVLTESTVKSHLNRIYSKLGVTSRTAALVKAREMGLV